VTITKIMVQVDSSGNASDLYLESTQFKCQFGNWLPPRLTLLAQFLNPSLTKITTPKLSSSLNAIILLHHSTLY